MAHLNPDEDLMWYTFARCGSRGERGTVPAVAVPREEEETE